MKKQLLASFLAIILIFAFSSGIMAAEENDKTITISLVVEGYKSTIYNKTVDVKFTSESITLATALSLICEQESALDMKDISGNYIYDINGESAGTFGGYDGWMFAVNDKIPSTGISEITINDGDKIVFYYADYPSQYTLIDSNNASDGIIRFYSNETNYETGESYESPITDADVVFDGQSYKTDDEGKINVGKSLNNGNYTVSIEKNKVSDIGNLPLIVRLSNYNLVIREAVEAPNYLAYIIVTSVVVLLILVGVIFLLKNKKAR